MNSPTTSLRLMFVFAFVLLLVSLTPQNTLAQTVSPSSLSFGIPTGTSPAVSAPQGAAVTIPSETSVTFGTATATAPFSIATDSCSGQTFTGTGMTACTVNVELSTTSATLVTGTLTIPYTENGASSSLTVALTGAYGAIKLNGETPVQLSLSSASFSDLYTISSSSLNLSCPAGVPLSATISGTPDGLGYVMVDNYIVLGINGTPVVTSLGDNGYSAVYPNTGSPYAFPPGNVCTGSNAYPDVDSSGNDYPECFSAAYRTNVANLVGDNTDSLANPGNSNSYLDGVAGGVPALNVSTFFAPGSVQASISALDAGGYFDSSTLFLVTNCSLAQVGEVVQSFPTTTPTTSNFTTSTGEIEQIMDLSTAMGNLQCNLSNGTTGACPTSLTLLSSNTELSNDPTWPPYVIGTPFATSLCTARPGNSGNTCSLYVNACFSGLTQTQEEADDYYCPSVNTAAGPGNYINLMDIWDPMSTKPCPGGESYPCSITGYTFSLINFTPSFVGETWAASNSAPNPVCPKSEGTSSSLPPLTNAASGNYGCDFSDSLVQIYGDQTTTSGKSPKTKGWLISVYKVAMPLTGVSVNGVSVNTPGVYAPAASANQWFNTSTLPLSFAVNPACPTLDWSKGCTAINNAAYNNFQPAPVAGENFDFTNLSGTVLYGPTAATPPPGFNTESAVPVTFTASQALPDGQYYLQWGAGDNVGIDERSIQLIPASGGMCPTPAGPVAGSYCYVTLPFEAQVNIDTTDPVLNGCTQTSAGPVYMSWYSTNVTFTCSAVDATSGIATATGAGVYSATLPLTGGVPLSFSLSTSSTSGGNFVAGSTSTNALTGSETLCDRANNCTTQPALGPFDIDQTPPTITGPTLPGGGTYTVPPLPQTPPTVTINYSCSDGQGSGVQSCMGQISPVPSGLTVPVPPCTSSMGGEVDTCTASFPASSANVGSYTFNVNSTDNVGNCATTMSPTAPCVKSSSPASFSVAYSTTPATVWIAGDTVPLTAGAKHGTTMTYVAGAVDVSSTKNPVSVFGADLVVTFTLPSGNTLSSGSTPTAIVGDVSCTPTPPPYTTPPCPTVPAAGIICTVSPSLVLSTTTQLTVNCPLGNIADFLTTGTAVSVNMTMPISSSAPVGKSITVTGKLTALSPISVFTLFPAIPIK